MRRKRTKIKNGDKFGRLTILSFSHHLNSHKVFNVLCDCGTRKTVTGTHMVQGNIRSCGCLKTELKQKEPGHATYQKIFTQYKSNARNRELIFNLTFDQFKKVISQNCFYCNKKPKYVNNYLKLDNTKKDERITQENIDRSWIKINGIDRLNNNKGYTIKNSVPCCSRCNEMKMDDTSKNFLNQVKRIYFNKKKNI